MTQTEKPTAAYLLSMIGGIFIILGGGMMSMMGAFWFGGMMGGFRGWGGMMGYGGPGYGMMGWLGFGVFGILGIVFGAIVVISAVMLNSRPHEHSTWGMLIIVFSALSLVGGGMGGLGVGLVLGLVGGILAVTWKPKRTQTTT
jgi:hypothetical protein